MTTKKYTNARGFHDYDPKECLERQRIIKTIRKVFKKHKFLPYETPVVEQSETLLEQHGGEAKKLIFHLLDSGRFLAKFKGDFFKENSKIIFSGMTDEAFRNYISSRALRYDFTASLRRYLQGTYASETLRKDKTLRLYQIGSVFRADKPQRMRFRQFTQCDADKIYTNKKELEAMEEVIYMTIEILHKFKIWDFEILINHKTSKDMAKQANYFHYTNYRPKFERGVSYYTGFMFEVKVKGEPLSVLGGGGYDVGRCKGIGLSFGLERLHGVLKNLWSPCG